jgi:FtsH-binding integral membrane protein
MSKKPKTPPKMPPKSKRKAQPQPVSITSSKTYWITLTAVMLVFGSVYGYMMKVAVAAIVLLLACVLFMIGFAYYLKFKPSTLKNNSRATFIFVGASVVGFCIWVAIVLLLSAVGFWPQIAISMGERFFATASLVICLITGGFIGDLVGNNKERISMFLRDRFGG